VRKGANYGWSVLEGSHPFYLNRKAGPTPFSKPIAEHPHSEFRSLTGGVVYRGSKLPGLRGAYVYGDFSTGKIWGIRHRAGKVVWHKELASTTLQVTGFGLDTKGELLIADHGGSYYRLEETPKGIARRRFPTKLSETGLFFSVKEHKPQPALVPYSVNAPLWSDGAAKERFLALPGLSKIDRTQTRGWNFPDGSVLVKTFSLDLGKGKTASRQRVETRLLTRQEGQWVGYSYAWNEEQTDAELVAAAGLDRPYTVRDPQAPGGSRKQTWRYPSRTECMVCHSRAANFVLGMSTLQMNKDHDYGGVVASQMRTLEHLGLFTRPLPNPPEKLPRLADPGDRGASLEKRARSYLHANCAQCHVEAGGGNAMMQLEFTTPRAKMQTVGVSPHHHTFGVPGAKLIDPGHPERSLLYLRVARRGEGQMPPLATSQVDREAARLLHDWIKQMKP
jgi:uncharacterized repeat protein (TIGR03806 family)